MPIQNTQNVKDKATIFVIFGATGDLSQKKLFPSLFELFSQNLLPEKIKIIATARSPHSTQDFTNNLKKILKPKNSNDWSDFSRIIKYLSSDIANNKNLDTLSSEINSFEKQANTCVMRVYYLAISPQIYQKAFINLGKNKLNLGCVAHNSKARIVVEKPFGSDFKSAQKLQEVLSKYFTEDQTYRIDHLLGKETVQNILTFRFGNELFEPIWNNKYINQIQITYAEHIGIEKRGDYYDQTGALRDMVQNHMLRLLSFITMEAPQKYDHTNIRAKRLEIIKSIKPMTQEDIANNTIRGQYEGYRQEVKVNSNSTTETYTFLKLFIQNQRWQGVPIYLRTGKKLAGKATSIIISFKEKKHQLLENFWDKPLPNHITLQIQPNEGIGIQLAAKKPGLTTEIEPVNMEFCYKTAFDKPQPDAYERLLMDIILGDQTLFLGKVSESWKVIDPIRKVWDSDKPKLETYKPGSWGPASADHILARDNHYWLAPLLAICKI